MHMCVFQQLPLFAVAYLHRYRAPRLPHLHIQVHDCIASSDQHCREPGYVKLNA